jgi:hypothetical protein
MHPIAGSISAHAWAGGAAAANPKVLMAADTKRTASRRIDPSQGRGFNGEHFEVGSALSFLDEEAADGREEAALSSGSFKKSRRRPTLPPRLQGSTIGAGGLNFWVRNGTRCFPSAMTTGNR